MAHVSRPRKERPLATASPQLARQCRFTDFRFRGDERNTTARNEAVHRPVGGLFFPVHESPHRKDAISILDTSACRGGIEYEPILARQKCLDIHAVRRQVGQVPPMRQTIGVHDPHALGASLHANVRDVSGVLQGPARRRPAKSQPGGLRLVDQLVWWALPAPPIDVVVAYRSPKR